MCVGRRVCRTTVITQTWSAGREIATFSFSLFVLQQTCSASLNTVGPDESCSRDEPLRADVCVFVCHRWVPVKVRTVPHLRRPWQRWLKNTRRMEEVPATSFPWRQPLPWELFVSSVINLLCSPPHPLNRTDLPRAPWTKPEYSCLEKNLHPVGITHCTRKLSMWLEAPPPFSWFLIFLHWGSEMINLLILRKWKLFWGYLVLTLDGAFGLDWELLKHFFVRESVFMPFLNCSRFYCTAVFKDYESKMDFVFNFAVRFLNVCLKRKLIQSGRISRIFATWCVFSWRVIAAAL